MSTYWIEKQGTKKWKNRKYRNFVVCLIFNASLQQVITDQFLSLRIARFITPSLGARFTASMQSPSAVKFIEKQLFQSNLSNRLITTPRSAPKSAFLSKSRNSMLEIKSISSILNQAGLRSPLKETTAMSTIASVPSATCSKKAFEVLRLGFKFDG